MITVIDTRNIRFQMDFEKSEYIETLKSLVVHLYIGEPEKCITASPDERYFLGRMLYEMLPDCDDIK